MLIGVIETVGRVRFDDVARTSLYRPRFFGKSWLTFARNLMRGSSDWTPGERELMAAFVSRLNECPYCVGVHTGTASLGLGRDIGVAKLDGWRDLMLDPRLRAVFELLTKRPSDSATMQKEDFDRARAA